MWRWSAIAFLAFSWTVVLAPTSSFAQQETPESKRKVVSRVIPVYPGLARNMNLRGAVRVDALVEPNGTVKSVEVKGGHPIFTQAAESAVRKWKWEPAARETRELIEVRFDPH